MTCPKCHKTSGDDWSQCGGECPMPGSPHYLGTVERARRASEIVRRKPERQVRA